MRFCFFFKKLLEVFLMCLNVGSILVFIVVFVLYRIFNIFIVVGDI